ncbi:hypothetical protein ACH5RR_038898 [Cinchona calisaya]|uniref:PH domain-containing protein n=1 Tax=Cinchona calisaya TaxID=153742 RepID=A0ABD2XZL9_9GENT
MTIEEVKRTAQQEVNRALKDQARFFLDLDIAAPKITIPTDFYPDDINSTKLLLDLGNLVIRTQDDSELVPPEEMNMYLQFDLILSDVSAFLVDGDYHWNQSVLDRTDGSSKYTLINFLPIIDKCGVIVKLQQIRLENSLFPSTRLAMRLPSLGFHFSPARYHRLMQVAKIFQGENEDNADVVRPWNQADFEGWLSVLAWKGMGGREAIWQRKYLCIVGPFLYLLDNPNSRSYKQYLSLRGKQLHHIPADTADNLEHMLAVCDSELPISKILEDPNALVLRCDSEDSRRTWQSWLQGAIYRASGSTAITGLSETSSDSEDSEIERVDNHDLLDSSKAEKVFLTGVLDELKICFNYNSQHDQNFMKVFLAEERRLFEFRATGGRVELSMKGNDMFIGTVLKALEVEDLICRRGKSHSCYLARSVIQSSDASSLSNISGDETFVSGDLSQGEADDEFYEASETLNDESPQSLRTEPEYFSSQNFLSSDNATRAPSFSRLAGLLPTDNSYTGTDSMEASDTLDSFVKAQIVVYDKNSSLYDGTDTKVAVSLATLSFFCRRPTVLAIMDFVNAINAEDDSCESFSDTSTAMVRYDVSDGNVVDKQASDIFEEPVAKGLLGKGKSRVIFDLTLNMARAQILLLKENGSKLATLSQDNFLTDIKVFPSSFSIKASLGNLRISDDSLNSKHIYFWACDMRNPGGSSFVELVFCSFSPDDEDYEGYDYSLVGQLSEVRIVYLNRFLQEVISYFMGLVPRNSVDIIRVKDQKTNAEKSFTRSEIEGSPAVKLDLSLRKPIILMPRRTDSLDYLKLDIVHITVQNTFQWFCGSRHEINAVHMEILTLKVEDINLNVGSGTELGESIMQDVKGIAVLIQRPLRDLLHQLPGTEVTIKIEEFKAALSSKEYEIITECAQSNFSETPNLVPELKDVSLSTSVDVVGPSTVDSDVTESGSLGREMWIATKVSVIIDLIELNLYYGLTRDASLATLKVSGGWLLYKSNTLGDGFLSATLKDFTVLDDREGTEQELRLAIRKPETNGYNPTDFLTDEEIPHKVNKLDDRDGKLFPTMLILDARFSEHSTSLFLCIQRPQLLVALDFLLDLVEFFVPTVRSMLSNEEDKNSSCTVDAIILDQSTYSQPSAEFSLSPLRPLVADDERFDLYVYDGRGGRLYLQDRQGSNLSSPSMEAIFFVGTGKKLQFKNVTIKNGQYLDSCMLLGSNSSYSASEDDKVFLEEGYGGHSQSNSGESSNSLSPKNVAVSRSVEIVFELQAIGPELTFYNTSKDVGKSLLLSNKLLHTQLDAFCRLVQKGDTIEMSADALGFTMESNGIKILEPFDTSMTYSNASGKTNVKFIVSDIYMNFSFSILRLFLAVEDDILAFMRMSSKKVTLVCSEFDKIGTFKNPSNDQIYAFWRPRAPPGFATLGDYLTPVDKPPTKGVVAVNTSFVRVKRPESFKLVWPSTSTDDDSLCAFSNGVDGEDTCSIWFPEAPKGYVSLGCVVSPGRTEPPVSSAHCILASLVSTCGLRDCINIHFNSRHSSLVFWRVYNSVGTFLPADPTTMSLIGKAYELRHLVFGFPEISSQTSKSSDIQAIPSGHEQTIQSERSSTVNSARRFEAVATFRLIWWNQGTGSRKKLSIWRPIVPEGMVYFGDIAVKGYEPPSTCVVLHDSGEELYKYPLDFQFVGQIKKHRGVDNISFWLPQAPPGFVSLGCVACKGTAKLLDFSSLRCIRSDMVTGDQFLDENMWDTSDIKFMKEPFSIWMVGNELGTFIVRSGFKKPPKRFALKLAVPDIASGSDDTVIDAEIRTFSAALFDDYSGLMVPLCNLSLSSIGFSLHGRQDFSTSCVSFSVSARSYNDKYDAWEPLIEPVDGLLRYEYNLNAPGSASQLRLTSTGDLNVNISVSNANMIFQAYASWNSLSQVHESNTEAVSPTDKGGAIIDMHHRKNYYLIPQNKLGQDIFIRVIEIKGLHNIIKMPSGERKPLKVPVSKNMLDSHLNGNLCEKSRQMVTIIIAEAELPKIESLASRQYTVAVRLTPNQSQAGQLQLKQQSARTCGTGSESSDDVEIVKWNEMFFFKIDSTDYYTVEMIVTDTGKGDAVGFFSSPLKQIATSQTHYLFNNLNELTWVPLSSAESKVSATGENFKKSSGRIRCSVLLSPKFEVNDGDKSVTGDRGSGFLEISPSRAGPWTTVRLNYAAPAACWQFGNNLVASEVSVHDGNRYVTIRSLVSVRNDTDVPLVLCLKLSDSSQKSMPLEGDTEAVNREIDRCPTDGFFENQQYNPAVGWVEYLDSLEGTLRDELPSGWEWDDEWHVDKSSVQTADGWVYAPDFEHLKWPESYNPLKSVNYARQRRWIRHRKHTSGDFRSQISVGTIRPGEVVPVPLCGLTQSASYVLQLRPFDLEKTRDYSWSSVVHRPSLSKDVGRPKENSEICISTLKETEELLHCPEIGGTSSSGSHSMWFCLKIQATEIAKNKNSDPIKDWSLVVKSPLSITNYLPLAAEFSVLEMQGSGHFLDCFRGVFRPGETVKIYNVDTRNPLYLSLLPQKGWLPLHEAILISHPSRAPSKTISLRSSISGRIVQLILDQNDIGEGLLQSKVVKVYSPYWLAIARCPPLTFRLVNFGGKRPTRKITLPFKSKKGSEVVLEEITDEELYEGYTIASALNFKMLGLSASVSQSGEEHFGPVKDLSPLGDMDGSLDLCAYSSDGNCMRLFLSSKPCTFQSVPTKVISIRPYMTFTNRLGENIFIKLSSEDEPKILHAWDARVSFVYREAGPMVLQVRLDDTNWSFPFQVMKEDTIYLVMRKGDGTRRFLRTEIRGYEEGSRFIVVFRFGSQNGPIRIENRTRRRMRIRQSGFGDETWIQLCPLSTTNFSWEDPYGQKYIDTEIHEGDSTSVCKFNLDKSGLHSEGEVRGLLFYVIDLGAIKVARFLDETTLLPCPREGSNSAIHVGSVGNSHMESKMQENASPLQLIVEMQALGISVVDHRPKELSYLYLERVFISYSTGYDGGTTSRFKLILGYLQLDNQLPLTLMPVLLAPEQTSDINHPVFKMTVTVSNKSVDGIQIYPYVYIRVTDKCWRLNVHEPIIWAFIDLYNNLQLDRINQSSSITQVDPEIRVDLIDISEVRLKVSLETSPAQRPQGVLGVWSPILSALGNAFKIQIHLRKLIRRDRFMRKSSVISAIASRLWRDLIHNPLHLIFSVDVLGMTSSTLASLSKGFAELSTDGQFLQLRSKQVWSRRIGGVGDGIIQGTEALAQGVAFGVSGVLRKPVESARENGLLGLAHGLGQAFLGFIVQPVSGALDFVSLTVDGIGASCSRCLDILHHKTSFQRIRNPRAIHADNILTRYCEREATGQMILSLAEASRQFGCTELFKEPSKFAWSDLYEDHFLVPFQRIVLVTNKRVMLLQCVAPDKMDKKPCKILWDVPWEEILALELAKAGFPVPSHLIIHLKNFRRSENFVRVIKCHTEESNEREPQAVRICFVLRNFWKGNCSRTSTQMSKIPSSQRQVCFTPNEASGSDPRIHLKSVIKSTEIFLCGSASDDRKLVTHCMNFSKVWSSEQESKGRCTLCQKKASEEGGICSIWRPICPDGYISVGDIVRAGSHSPNVSAVYHYSDKLFALPVGFDLVWRNCPDDYISPVSIWHPRAPMGYVSLGCVAMHGFKEPQPNTVYCISESLSEETVFEEQKIWSAPDSYPWACHIYQVHSEALHFVALRQPKEESDWKPMRVLDDLQRSAQPSEAQLHSHQET